MTEEDHTPVYLTRYQLKKSQQHQTNDDKITTPRGKSTSRSNSSNSSVSAKFSRKVEPIEKNSHEPKRRRKVSPITVTKRQNASNALVEDNNLGEVKGTHRTRKININPDKSSGKNDTTQMLLMPGLEFLFGGLLEEANSRLNKRSRQKRPAKVGDLVEAKLKGWPEIYDGEIHSINEDKTYDIRFDDGEMKRNIKRKEFKLKITDEDDDDNDSDWGGDIEGKPEEVEYTEDEHSYVTKLDKAKQCELMNLESEILKIKKDEKPIRFKILELNDLTANSKANIISKIDHFYSLDSTDNEYHKLSTWVETLERIPFGKYIEMPVKADSSIFEVGNFLCDTRKILDDAVFGHNEAKDKIITTIAKQISNPNGGGTCIGIQGPPGNGKTTLVKEGICKAMKRPFSMVALGGMQDSSFMMGHEYTYEGSKPGRIIEILGESGCMNPVIYFDELDKISKTQKGEEIENFLCHLTDSSQNSEFHDKYMSGINFDLSKATFIFSYNDPTAVNPILLDRIYKIKTDGFSDKSKLEICKNYLLPNILEECNFTRDDIKFTDSAIKRIIQNYTDSEKGVRNLKRAVETVVAKINVLRYMYPTETLKKLEIVKDELTSEVDTSINEETSPEKTEAVVILDKIIDTIVNSDDINSDTSNDGIGIKLTVSEKSPDLSVNKVIEVPTKLVEKEFTADKIMDSKIKKFSLPFEVNDDNLSKFIKSISYNPSLAHLYL